ncbi:hypothetical protein BH09BAC1_BH09BAC1_12200 [soil metagenome]
MNAYTPLLHIHSTLRYALLLLLVIAIIKALIGWLSRKEYTKADKTIGTVLIAVTHVQALIGIILYFVSPFIASILSGGMGEAMKNSGTRFWAVEHFAGMLIAVILITVGRARSKRIADPVSKHRTLAIFFLIAFALIMYMIPWSERGLFVGQ